MTQNQGQHPNGSAGSRGLLTRLSILACILLPVFVYAVGLRSPFVFDDTFNIVDNPDIKSGVDHLMKKILSPDPAEPRERAELARPVTFISFALNYGWGGMDPLGYHLFNLALHILTTLLIFFLSRRVFFLVLEAAGPAGPPPPEGKKKQAGSAVNRTRLDLLFSHPDGLSGISALCVALLFAVHPIQSEVILYTSNRSDSLATLFYLLSLLGFAKAAEGRGAIWSGLCWGSFLLSFLSKQIAATLPLSILIFDYVFLCGMEVRKLKERWMLHLPLWLFLGGLYGFQAFYSHQTGVWLEHALQRWTRWSYLATQPYAILNYIGLMLLPFWQCIDHNVLPPESLMDAHVFFSAAALGILLVFLLHLCRTAQRPMKKMIFFSAAWFFVTLLPTSSIMPINDALVERRVYLPGWGFFIGLVLFYLWAFNLSLTERKKDEPPQPGAFLTVILLHIAVLSVFTVWRSSLYRHPERLWEEAIGHYPENPRAYYNLGRVYHDEKQYQAALSAYKKTLEISPKYTEAYNNMGVIYSLMKDTAAAQDLYDRATQASPGSASLYFNKGILSYKNKDYAGAEASYLKAVELDPKFYKAYNNLAVVYTHNQQYDKAIEVCKKSLEINPGYGVAHYNLGNVYSKMNDNRTALKEFQTALQLMPDNATIKAKVAEAQRLAK